MQISWRHKQQEDKHVHENQATNKRNDNNNVKDARREMMAIRILIFLKALFGGRDLGFVFFCFVGISAICLYFRLINR